MSGLNIVESLRSIISIIATSIEIFGGAYRDTKLLEIFYIVGPRLRLLLRVLRICHHGFDNVKASLNEDSIRSLETALHRCEANAKRLRAILQDTITGEDTNRLVLYQVAVENAGQGKTIEQLLMSISERVYDLAGYHTVEFVRQEVSLSRKLFVGDLKEIEYTVRDEVFGCMGPPRTSFSIIDDLHFSNHNIPPFGEIDASSNRHEILRERRAAEADVAKNAYAITPSNYTLPIAARASLALLIDGDGNVGDVLSQAVLTCLTLDLDLNDFVSTELGGCADDIWNMVVLSGPANAIWAGSVQEYVSARWPQSIETIKRIILTLAGSRTYVEGLQSTMDGDMTGSPGYITETLDVGSVAIWSNNIAKFDQSASFYQAMQDRNCGLVVSVSSNPSPGDSSLVCPALHVKVDRRADVVEALGWLYTVLQNGTGNAFPCAVRLTITRKDDRGTWCTFKHQRYAEYHPDVQGRCWLPLLPHTACAVNFVHPFWRPGTDELVGIELTFDLMITLCGLYYGTEHEGGIILCGDRSFVYPVARLQNCVQWHFQPCEPGDNPRQVINGRLLKGHGLDDLRVHTKHFLGLWAHPEIILGAEDEPRKVQFSSAKTLGATLVRDNFAIGGSVKLPWVITLTGSATYKILKTRQTSVLKGSVVDQLHSKINSPVLLYSPSEKRAWLVSFVSVVLHIARCRASARAELGYSVPACKKSANGGRAAWECIKEHQDQCVKQVALHEPLTDLEKSFKVIDHVEEVMTCVNLLRRETNSARGVFRDRLLGFELAALTMYKDSATLKECELEAFAEGWRPLLDTLESVFLYEGISDPIIPSSASVNTWSQAGACGAAMPQRVPSNLNLLAASLPCLLSIAEEQGQNEDGTMKRLTPNHTWHCPTGDSLYASCGIARPCSCDRLQRLISTGETGESPRIPRICFSDKNTGAVLFAYSKRTTMADLHASAAKDRILTLSDATAGRADSGYVSKQSRDYSPPSTIGNSSQGLIPIAPSPRIHSSFIDTSETLGTIQGDQVCSNEALNQENMHLFHSRQLQHIRKVQGQQTHYSIPRAYPEQIPKSSQRHTLDHAGVPGADAGTTQFPGIQQRNKKYRLLNRILSGKLKGFSSLR